MISKTCSLLLIILLCALTVPAQTYTDFELVSGPSALPWQVQYDPAARLTVGNDDGNATAAPHASSWATVIRYGGAHGLPGLLDEFTVSSEGAPRAFGLGDRNCAITSEATLETCLPVRWEPSSFFGPSVMVAVVATATHGTASFLEYNVQPGDVFSIERDGYDTIRFYRSTGTPGERRRIGSYFSPFGSTPVDVRGAFAPASGTRKLWDGRETYYCCL